MFERRLKIFLSILLVFVLVLLARAMQLQVIERDYWREQASASMRSETLADSTRGRILDCHGAVLAEDEPCTDVCVDYRFITKDPDPTLLNQMASKRMKDRLGDDYTHTPLAQRKKILADETSLLKSQIEIMWEKLAQLSGTTRDAIEARRQSIQDRVEMRRRVIWYRNYRKALADHAPKEDPPWYRRWIMGETTDVPDIDEVADQRLDEESAPHVIIESIESMSTPDGTPLLNELQKHADEYPGMSLRPSTHRAYPFGNAACHVIGHLGKVWKEDIASDPNLSDELRAYSPNDVKGRDGLEALGEPTLRGVRGITVSDGVSKQLISSSPPRLGEDLRTTLDIELQTELQELFLHVKIPYTDTKPYKYDEVAMHGAAVVIEVNSGDVVALVSAPDFDLNRLDEQYALMAKDNLDAPLMNRATQALREPGSTVKPIVGAGAITQGVLGVNEGIECTGYLTIVGKRYEGFGKCWTVGVAKTYGISPLHHPFPVAHQGHDGNGPGFLTYSDALERSCNVFFETTADRLKIGGLSYWMRQFGLGRPTGIGIAEACGKLPNSYMGGNTQFATWTAGIGQGSVLVTPLQMANVAATIARRGIWVRPSLVATGQNVAPFRPRSAAPDDANWNEIPSRMDLHIAPAAIDAAFDGMMRVVNGEAGTGTYCARPDMTVAGKTGTVQAARFMVPDVDADGNKIMRPLEPSTHEKPNTDHPWYRASDEKGEKLNHAWFIGFVPAEKPKYAISVMVEYGGGGGGIVAGPIAKQIIEALVKHGYLQPRDK